MRLLLAPLVLQPVAAAEAADSYTLTMVISSGEEAKNIDRLITGEGRPFRGTPFLWIDSTPLYK